MSLNDNQHLHIYIGGKAQWDIYDPCLQINTQKYCHFVFFFVNNNNLLIIIVTNKSQEMFFYKYCYTRASRGKKQNKKQNKN